MNEIVAAHAHLPLTSTNLDLPNTSTHACNRLFPVEEEDKEKLSSVGSSSSGGHSLDTDAVQDALIKFKSRSSTDSLNPKRRQYSIDVIETSAEESKRDLLNVQTKVSGKSSPLIELADLTEDLQDVEDGNKINEASDIVKSLGTGNVEAVWKECKDAEKEISSVKDLGTWKERDTTEPTDKSDTTDRNGNKVKLEKICEEHEETTALETTALLSEKRPACRTRYIYRPPRG